MTTPNFEVITNEHFGISIKLIEDEIPDTILVVGVLSIPGRGLRFFENRISLERLADITNILNLAEKIGGEVHHDEKF